MVTVAVLLLKVPTAQVTPTKVLETVQAKVGVAEKLLTGDSVSVDVPFAPGFIVRELGVALSEKSAAPVVKLDAFDQVAVWVLPEGVSACTSQ